MKITVTNIVPLTMPSGNLVYHMSWKKDGEPDSSYVPLPDLTTDANGVVIFPTPYDILTGTVTDDIWVRAISACNVDYVVENLFEGLGLCCPEGYVMSPDGLSCNFTETTAPTITQAGVCVACSQLSPEYGVNGTKFWPAMNYNVGLSDANYTLLNTSYWAGNPAGSGSSAACGDSTPTPGSPPSPMNRNGVWIDTNCDGTKNPLASGSTLQFTWLINAPVPKTVYVGIAGDNNFTLTINGTIIVQRTNAGGTDNFTYLYLFPVNLISGSNFINAQFVGDGSVNDAGVLIIIDNSAASIPGVTSDAEIDYIFQTSQLIGAAPIDIATCPDGYTLDTSGGSGNYICVRITTTPATAC